VISGGINIVISSLQLMPAIRLTLRHCYSGSINVSTCVATRGEIMFTHALRRVRLNRIKTSGSYDLLFCIAISDLMISSPIMQALQQVREYCGLHVTLLTNRTV
jgi:hypothetical protein